MPPKQNMITRLKKSLEQTLDEQEVCEKLTSPGLARLRMTPGMSPGRVYLICPFNIIFNN